MVHIIVKVMDNLTVKGDVIIHEGHLDGDHIELAFLAPDRSNPHPNRMYLNTDEAEGVITALQLAVKHARPKKVRLT